MPRLPPVPKSPQGFFRATLSPGVGYSVVTFDQSHSSSSATICASPVSVPWPISERAMRMTTVSSGRMTTQALTSGETLCARATPAPNGIFNPRASPLPTAAVPTRNERRSIFRVVLLMASPPFALRGGVAGVRPSGTGPASWVVRDCVLYWGFGGFGFFFEQRRDRHDHARLAVAALRHVIVDPGFLDLVQRTAIGQAL